VSINRGESHYTSYILVSGLGQGKLDPPLTCINLATSFRFVPKLCPKDVRNIKTYLKISNSIEIREPLKTRVSQRNYIIFYTLRFSAASYTR
jgi:hypothetical protein